jgi:hypothetical protein
MVKFLQPKILFKKLGLLSAISKENHIKRIKVYSIPSIIENFPIQAIPISFSTFFFILVFSHTSVYCQKKEQAKPKSENAIEHQESDDNFSSKKHFEIDGLLTLNEKIKVEEALNNYGLLDAYRFDNQRRKIDFEGVKATVVLYSNNELYKPQSPKREALKSAPQGQSIHFAITPKGKLKVLSEQ